MSVKGDAILLKARSEFRSLRTPETMRRVAVPEWDCTIYYWPVRSMEERIAIEARITMSGGRSLADLTQLHLANVLHRSRDEFGIRLFSDDQVEALSDTQPAVLERVSLAMGLGDGLTVEVAEKN